MKLVYILGPQAVGKNDCWSRISKNNRAKPIS